MHVKFCPPALTGGANPFVANTNGTTPYELALLSKAPHALLRRLEKEALFAGVVEMQASAGGRGRSDEEKGGVEKGKEAWPHIHGGHRGPG